MTKSLMLLLALFSLPLTAAELLVPEPFNVLAVNGKEGFSSMQRLKRVPLQTGSNVIVLEFDQLFDASYGDSHDRIRSKPFALSLVAQAGDQLTLDDPKLQTGDEARRWVATPALRVQHGNGQAVKTEVLSVEKIAGEWLLPGASLAALSKPSQNAPTAAPATAATVAATTAGNIQAAPVATPDTLQMLHYFWQQATPEQRAQFLQTVSAGK